MAMKRKTMDPAIVRHAAAVLKIISHPVRLRLIEGLAGKKQSVGELIGQLGCTQVAASKHLAVLKKAGLVDCHRDRNYRNYFLKRPEVLKVLECVSSGCQKEHHT